MAECNLGGEAENNVSDSIRAGLRAHTHTLEKDYLGFGKLIVVRSSPGRRKERATRGKKECVTVSEYESTRVRKYISQ